MILPDLDIQKLVKRMVAARPDRISMEQVRAMVDNSLHPNNNYHNNNFRRSPILSYSSTRNCSIEIIYFSIKCRLCLHFQQYEVHGSKIIFTSIHNMIQHTHVCRHQ